MILLNCRRKFCKKVEKKLSKNGEMFYAIYFLSFCILWTVSADVALAGFGCPLNRYQCHSHCQSIGRKGGYCGGWWSFTCTCYRTKKVIQTYHSLLSFAIGVVRMIWSQIFIISSFSSEDILVLVYNKTSPCE